MRSLQEVRRRLAERFEATPSKGVQVAFILIGGAAMFAFIVWLLGLWSQITNIRIFGPVLVCVAITSVFVLQAAGVTLGNVTSHEQDSRIHELVQKYEKPVRWILFACALAYTLVSAYALWHGHA